MEDLTTEQQPSQSAAPFNVSGDQTPELLDHSISGGSGDSDASEGDDRSYVLVKRLQENGIFTGATSPDSSDSSAALDFWRTVLKGCDGVAFPVLPDPEHLPSPDAELEHDLPRLEHNATGISPLALIRAAWALVVSRSSGSENVVFGVLPTSDQQECTDVEPVPFRVKIDGESRVLDYLKQLQHQGHAISSFQTVNWAQIVEDIPGGKRASQFQTVLLASEYQHNADNSNTTSHHESSCDPHTTHRSLNIEVETDQAGQARLRAKFDPKVIAADSVMKLAQRFGFVLSQLWHSSDDQLLRDISTCTPHDLSQIWEWNTSVPPSAEATVVEMVEDQSKRTPDACAVNAWDGQLTYARLVSLATDLAAHLTNRGVAQGVVVPVCFEKSMWTTVALLGILKAGGAFVLLDASLPEKRLKTIVDQVGAPLIVTSPTNESLSRRLASETITIDTGCFQSLEQVSNQQLSFPPLSSTMYIVFTSGSTGTPKGVVMTHGNHAAAIRYVARKLGVTPESRIFDFSAYSFDISIFNAFAALTAGGCLCVPSSEDRQNNLSESISSLGANFLYVTPTVARHLRPEQVPTVRTLVLIGEPVYPSDLEPWWGKVQVINTYGPSECGTASTINAAASSLDEAVSIGTGVGATTWIVDPENHNMLVPPGQVGELLIEGPIVGSGYLGDAEKTASSFIKDPSWLLQGASGHPGRQGAVYKTGDLVRLDDLGRLHFQGRKDGQVKIRGNRVELGEVEQRVRECVPDATHVVAEVLSPKGDSSGQVLVAFLQVKTADGIPPASASPTAAPHGIRDKLAGFLPGYMIPTLFFHLEAIPTTPSGKTDRIELRRIGSSFSASQLASIRTSGHGPKRQPVLECEIQMRQIWAKVLGLEEATIGSDDSFLELGGDSASAMKLVAEARKVGLQITVAEVFNHPLLHEVANGATPSSTSPQDFTPFSLLGGNVDVSSFLQELSQLYELSAANIQDVYPCTPLQEGLLSLAAKSPREYITQGILELADETDIDQFRSAWDTVVRETEILRTRVVPFKDAGCFQVVLDEGIDWVETSDLDDYLAADRARTMAFGHSMARYTLVESNNGRPQWFVWTIHHALFDGWSMSTVLDMVERTYRGDTISPVPGFQPFIQYIRDQDTEAVKEYWRESLAGCDSTPFPALPPIVEQPIVDKISEHVLPGLTQNSSPFTTSTLVRAAWAMIVAQLTGSADVVFGSTMSGRSAPVVGIEDIPAPTITTLPIRIQVTKGRAILDFLEAIQTQATEMIPFEQVGLHQIAQISADTRQACAFQTLLVIQPEDESHRRDSLGKWQLGSQQQTLNTYGLILEVHTGADIPVIKASYDSRAIKPWLVQSILRRFDFLLHQLNHCSPITTLADVRSVTPSDLQQLWDWNRTVPATVPSLIHEVIEETASSRPNEMAICAWDVNMSYKQVEELSTKVAWLLVERQVGLGKIIPLFFEKSAWTVVAMLGVLKAGAAFVLLDVTMPEERLKTIVKAVTAGLIVSSTSNQAIASKLGAEVLTLNESLSEDMSSFVNYEQSLPPKPSPTSTAYVIFTSGSTGTPKGAMVTHQNVTSAIPHHIESLGYQPDARIYDFSSYSFDASIHAILSSLVAGACLCVPSDADRRDNLGGSLASFQATHVLLTPSVAQFVSPESVPSLRTLILGGEAVRTKDVKPWWNKAKVITAYGPSECATISTINANASSMEEVASIGTGSGGVAWVVDPDNHDSLLPVGCVGELLVEGPLVGQGYLGEPGKTAQAFIRAPDWLKRGTNDSPGRDGLLYKTGDLVRYDDTGRLTFVGRKDAQVKIRGQRVELGEVEYWLQEFLTDAHAVAAEVVVPQGGNGAPTLAAFIQSFNNAIEIEENLPSGVKIFRVSRDTEDLLAQHLPSYMIPTIYLSMRELPMTGTGKLHRKRLGEIGSFLSSDQLARARASDSQMAKRQPTEDIELQLRDIWAKVLNLQEMAVGLDDGFLQLGGDSITAMQVASLARASSIQVQVADVIRERTLFRLAKKAVRRGMDGTKQGPVTVPPGSSPAQLSPIQNLYFHYQHDPNVCFDQHFYLKLARDNITQDRLNTALSSIVARHASLRARFEETSPGRWAERTSEDILGSLSTSVVGCSSSWDASEQIMKCRQRLNISNGPIIAAVLIQAPDSQSLFITAHHLVVDLVSWRAILKDLEELLTTGIVTATPSIDFATWTTLQAQFATRHFQAAPPSPADARGALSYWGMEANTNLRSGVARRSFVLDETVTAALLGKCNDAFHTRPFELLVSALIHSFGRAFKTRSSPVVYAEGHGREAWDDSIDVSTTVGWFTTIFPVSTPGAKPSLRDVVRETKDFIRSQPRNGWSHFVSRFSDEAIAASSAKDFPVELLFNYTGGYQQFERNDGLFEKLELPEGSDPPSNGQVRRFSLFEVDVEVDKGCIGVTVEFHKDMRHQTEISSWVGEYEQRLRQVAQEFSAKSPEMTLSELSLAFKDYGDLDEFRERLLPQLNISADDIEDIFPCAPIQEGILVAQGKDPDCYRSWFDLTVQILGDAAHLDVLRLQQAWRQVVQKHALLRTILVESIPGSNRMMNIILKDPTLDIILLKSGEAASPIGLQAHGLQHRMTISPVDEKSARLRIEMSHAITDAFSKAVLQRDLAAAYNGEIGSAAGTYRDFVVFLEAQSHDESLKFWTQHLADVEPCTLPTHYSNQLDVASFVDEKPVRISGIDTENLRAFCAKWDVTAPSIVKLAWALVLRLYTGTNIPCFGNIFSGRDVPLDGVDDIFGPLIGMVPCRVVLDQSASILQTLRAVQDDYLSTLPYQHFPLSHIHKASGSGANALFNTMFSYQRLEKAQTLDIPEGLRMTDVDESDPTEVRTIPAAINCSLNLLTNTVRCDNRGD